jgi:hypothetical protein
MGGVLNIIGWSFVTAVTAWGITLSWAKLALAQSRAALNEEIRYWHTEAMRARELAGQLKQEIAIWSKGCQQGREDVIAIMPLLITAQEGLQRASPPEMTLADMTEV